MGGRNSAAAAPSKESDGGNRRLSLSLWGLLERGRVCAAVARASGEAWQAGATAFGGGAGGVGSGWGSRGGRPVDA